MTNVAHYRGDVTNFPPDMYVGADTAGAFYRPVSATYDAETDRTTVQFKPILPKDMREYAEPHMQQMYQKVDLMELFGTGSWR